DRRRKAEVVVAIGRNSVVGGSRGRQLKPSVEAGPSNGDRVYVDRAHGLLKVVVLNINNPFGNLVKGELARLVFVPRWNEHDLEIVLGNWDKAVSGLPLC